MIDWEDNKSKILLGFTMLIILGLGILFILGLSNSIKDCENCVDEYCKSEMDNYNNNKNDFTYNTINNCINANCSKCPKRRGEYAIL